VEFLGIVHRSVDFHPKTFTFNSLTKVTSGLSGTRGAKLFRAALTHDAEEVHSLAAKPAQGAVGSMLLSLLSPLRSSKFHFRLVTGLYCRPQVQSPQPASRTASLSPNPETGQRSIFPVFVPYRETIQGFPVKTPVWHQAVH